MLPPVASPCRACNEGADHLGLNSRHLGLVVHVVLLVVVLTLLRHVSRARALHGTRILVRVLEGLQGFVRGLTLRFELLGLLLCIALVEPYQYMGMQRGSHLSLCPIPPVFEAPERRPLISHQEFLLHVQHPPLVAEDVLQ